MVPERIVRFRARTILTVLAIVLAVAALLKVLWIARQVLTWVLIAALLRARARPARDFLMRRGIRRRGLAIGIDLHPDRVVVVALGCTFIPTLVGEVNGFIDAVPRYVKDLTEGRGKLGFLERDYHLVERVQERRRTGERSRVLGVSGTAVAVTKGVITAIVATITIIVMTFFMLLEGPKWVERFFDAAPGGVSASVAADRARRLHDGRRLRRRQPHDQPDRRHHDRDRAARSSACRYAVALGLLVALLDLIPLAGATIAADHRRRRSRSSHADASAGIVVSSSFIVYQQLENHFLHPLVYGRPCSSRRSSS